MPTNTKPAADDRSPAHIRKLLDAAPTPLAKLRVPFAENQIGMLPKQVRRDDPTPPAGCKPGTAASRDGRYCGGYHKPSIHLDYVGHAALTDRLLEADETWSYEPMAVDDFGLPKFDNNGGLWINLTVAGVTRPGYGDAQGKTGPNAIKEAIGDALRNAGMRFGVALDLWHKGDLHDWAEEQGKDVTGEVGPAEQPPSAVTDWLHLASKAPTASDVLNVWRSAKKDGASAEILASITERGEKLRELEKAGEAPAPADEASDALRSGFGNPS